MLQTHSTLIKRTSAVTTTVLGEIKIVGLLVLSAILLGEASFAWQTASWCMHVHVGRQAGVPSVSCFASCPAQGRAPSAPCHVQGRASS